MNKIVEKCGLDKKDTRYRIALILSFVLPLVIMFSIFIGKGIYPFGDRSFLYSDMYHQYMPFFSEFLRKIKAGEGLAYSYHVGIGSNFLALYVYYLASPLHYLAFLVPEAYLMEFMSYLVIVKIALSGLTFFLYLKNHFQCKDSSILFFSCFYALSGFMAAYNWNIMWLDCVVLFPLIIWGLERLVKEGRCKMYCITLALSIFTNYYISIMICIFLVLYLIGLLITEKRSLLIIGNFAIYSLLAGGLAAVLLVPEICAILETDFGNPNFPDKLESYFSVFDMLARHCLAVPTERGLEHWPNIYCGVAVFLFLPMYVLNEKLSIKKRFVNLVLVGLLLLGFSTNILDFMWHGMNYPDSLPARQSFIYIFLILVMCFEAYKNVQEIDKKQILHGYLAAVVFLLGCEKFVENEDFYTGVEMLTLVFVTIYAVVLYLYRTRENSRWKCILGVVTLVAVVAECAINTANTSVGTTSRSSYLDPQKDYQALYQWIQEHETKSVADMGVEEGALQPVADTGVEEGALQPVADTDVEEGALQPVADTGVEEGTSQIVETSSGMNFYRVEKFSRKTKNDATLAAYPSASLFSSTLNSQVMDMYTRLGMRHSKVYYSFDGATAFTSALLNVKYMFGDSDKYETSMYELLRQSGDVYLYESKAQLPFGYVAPKGYDLPEGYENNGLRLQNAMIEELGIQGKLFTTVSSEQSGDDVVFTAKESGIYYALLTASGTKKVEAIGGSLETHTFPDLKKGAILYLGYLNAGEKITLQNGNEDDETPKISADIYQMDTEVLYAALEQLSQTHLENVTYNSTHMNGQVTMQEAGRLILSIPYEDGWHITINGEETEGERFGGALIAFDLEPGEYTISMEYTPEGQYAGILISVVSLGIFVLLMCVKKKKVAVGETEMQA